MLEKKQLPSKRSISLDEDEVGDGGESGHRPPRQTTECRAAGTGQQAHGGQLRGLLLHTPGSTLGHTLNISIGKQRSARVGENVIKHEGQ